MLIIRQPLAPPSGIKLESQFDLIYQYFLKNSDEN